MSNAKQLAQDMLTHVSGEMHHKDAIPAHWEGQTFPDLVTALLSLYAIGFRQDTIVQGPCIVLARDDIKAYIHIKQGPVVAHVGREVQ